MYENVKYMERNSNKLNIFWNCVTELCNYCFWCRQYEGGLEWDCGKWLIAAISAVALMLLQVVATMYQPTAPVVQFSQAPPQQGPVIQIMPQPQMQSYPPPAMPAMVVPQATDQKKDESRESYRRKYLLCKLTKPCKLGWVDYLM